VSQSASTDQHAKDHFFSIDQAELNLALYASDPYAGRDDDSRF
jgi:hypothetical protein